MCWWDPGSGLNGKKENERKQKKRAKVNKREREGEEIASNGVCEFVLFSAWKGCFVSLAGFGCPKHV